MPESRKCGTCTLCCKLLGVKELNKPAGKYCEFAKFGCGCQKYDIRPQECRTFECLWKQTEGEDGVPSRFHPSIYKFFFSMNADETAVVLYCDYNFELKPDLMEYLKHINKSLAIIFVKGEKRTYNPPGQLRFK